MAVISSVAPGIAELGLEMKLPFVRATLVCRAFLHTFSKFNHLAKRSAQLRYSGAPSTMRITLARCCSVHSTDESDGSVWFRKHSLTVRRRPTDASRGAYDHAP